MRILILAIALLFAAPAAARAQSAKQFKTPDSASKVSETLAWASEYLAPEIYEKWWREIAACEKLPLPLAHYQVRFYQVNAWRFYDLAHPMYGIDFFGKKVLMWAVGLSYGKDLEMYLALPHIYEEIILKHEMIHFLMYWAGEKPDKTLSDPWHPPARFETCGVTTQYYGPSQ